MSKLAYISRSYRCCTGTVPRVTSIRRLHTGNTLHEEKDDTDAKDSEPQPSVKEVEVQAKLKNLLLSMSQNKDVPESAKKIQIPRPRVEAQKISQKFKEDKLKAIRKAEEEELGNRLEKAAKNVADSLGGDTQKTEKELLELYLAPHESKTAPETSTAEEISTQSKTSATSMKDLLSRMKVDLEVPPELSRAHQVRARSSSMLDGKQFPTSRQPRLRRQAVKTIDIFSGTPLGIFTLDAAQKTEPPVGNPMWDYFHQRDLRLSTTHPPANIFEQLIMWTEQGKIWKFPIDNEQDMKEEENVDFTEHVFLERWLEPWCPETGPIRHFMELVCTGLSKNPYYSVAEKKAHIVFYEHYFRSRNALLNDLGVPPVLDRPEPQLEQA